MATRFSIAIRGFGQSEAGNPPDSPVGDDQVRFDKFTHVHVQAGVPDDIKTLQGKLGKISGAGAPGVTDFASTKIDASGQCEFVIGHFNLSANSTYFFRVADALTGETRCLASVIFKTK